MQRLQQAAGTPLPSCADSSCLAAPATALPPSVPFLPAAQFEEMQKRAGTYQVVVIEGGWRGLGV
jgi:hypothetical protein